MCQEYKIYAAIHSEARTGKVWNTKGLESNLIKIKIAKKSVVVSNRRIDPNFKREYEKDSRRSKLIENSIVMDEYYRLKLEIDKGKTYKAKILPVKAFHIHSYLRYLWQHSDDVVRITFWLAVISIVVSISGIFIPLFL